AQATVPNIPPVVQASGSGQLVVASLPAAEPTPPPPVPGIEVSTPSGASVTPTAVVPAVNPVPPMNTGSAPRVELPPPSPAPSPVPTLTPRPAPHPAALQVWLKLGDGQPRFEVCRGDDVLLKVVCTGIDVKAPSEKGEPFSVLRASGRVRFTA